MKYFEDLNFDPTQKLDQKIILRWLLNLKYHLADGQVVFLLQYYPQAFSTVKIIKGAKNFIG